MRKIKQLMELLNSYDLVDLIFIGCPDDEYISEAKDIEAEILYLKSVKNNITTIDIKNIIIKVFMLSFSMSSEEEITNEKDIEGLSNDVYLLYR